MKTTYNARRVTEVLAGEGRSRELTLRRVLGDDRNDRGRDGECSRKVARHC